VPLPLVSVITPTFGREAYLAAARQCFLSQTYPDLEWLILDDSPEPSAVFASESDARIRYTHSQMRSTIGEKRNKLIAEARGELILHFDDDDFYAPEYISTMAAALDRMNADLINLRGWYMIDFRCKAFCYWDLARKSNFRFLSGPRELQAVQLTPEGVGTLKLSHMGWGFTFCFRKKVWDAIRFPHVNFDEDGMFAREAATRFAVSGFADTDGICIKAVRHPSTMYYYPQFNLPLSALKQIQPRAWTHFGLAEN
jgi:glycosyltransferase involved in cell wall biosynthesis